MSDDSTRVRQVTDATFEREVLHAELPVLVDFGATWCEPCRRLAPTVARLAAELEGRIKVVDVDVDEAPETVRRYGIRGAPTLLVFRGGEKVAAHVGVASRARIVELLTIAR